MLASKIADLASLWLSVVTRWHLAANIWINVRTSGDAVAVRRDGHGVDVVQVRTIHIACREARQVDTEFDPSAIGIAGSLDGSANGGVSEGVGAGQSGLVRNARRISLDDLCVSKLASGARDDWAIEGRITFNGDRRRGSRCRWVLGADKCQARQSKWEDSSVHNGDGFY